MKTYIVLIPTLNLDAREICEKIENDIYLLDNVTSHNVLKIIELEYEKVDYIEVWELSDFMDLVNNREFNSDNYFISYVEAEQKD